MVTDGESSDEVPEGVAGELGADTPEASTEDSLQPPVIAGGGPLIGAVPDLGTWVGPREQPARYQLLELVGRGGEGDVYRGLFVGLGGGAPAEVAIKQYRPRKGAGPSWPHDGTWLQLSDQAGLLAGLPPSRHLVKVREVFLGAVSSLVTDHDPSSTHKTFETPFVVMEWVDGEPLDRLLREGRGSPADRLAWIRDLAAAIDHLQSVTQTHGTPLIHADIKPSNCIVHPTRRLVLIDTGGVHRLTARTGHRGLKSPPYTAPEALEAPGSRLSFAADRFSLGAVAFHVLTGQAPPAADRHGYEAEARAVLTERAWLPFGGAEPEVRERVATHVLQQLSREPYPRSESSATAWAQDLSELLMPVTTSPARRRFGAGPVVLGAASALLVAAATVAVLAWPDEGTTGSDPRPTASPTTSPSPIRTLADGTVVATWKDLPPFIADSGDALYRADFADDTWPSGEQGSVTTRVVDGDYELRITDNNFYGSVTAPSDIAPADEIVSATAAMTSGQGAWGVSCRGGYRFMITHARAVQITEPDDASGSGWIYLSGIDVARPTTLSARCRDVPGGPVELTLAVNGRTVTQYRPRVSVLGPGPAGLITMGFMNIGPPFLHARVSDFRIGASRSTD